MTRLARPHLVLAVALSALLLVGTASALAPTPGPTATDGDATPGNVELVANTTNQLTPEPGTTGPGGFGHARLDVAGAVATSAERLAGRHDRLTVSERLYGNDEVDARGIATDRLDAVEDRLTAIRAQQRSLFARYGNGSVARSTFTRRYAHIQAAADQEVEMLDGLGRDLGAVSPEASRAAERRIANLRGDLAPLDSPLAAEMTAVMNASRGGFTYYVAAGPDAHVLAMADETEFRREASVGANRDVGGTNQFAEALAPTLAAFNRAAELYDWAFGNAIRQSAKDFGTTHVYQIRVEHEQGILTLFLDGASRDVFRELQTKELAALPTTPSVTESSGGLAMSVNTTAPTGPMRIELESAGIDAPVNGTVRIGGDVVGVTGSDGVLWTVQPPADTAINATAGGDTVVARP